MLQKSIRVVLIIGHLKFYAVANLFSFVDNVLCNTDDGDVTIQVSFTL